MRRGDVGAAQTPLTHHEILSLVGPFTRSGRAVDLAASDRLARRLDFKPRDDADTGVREVLRLDDIGHDGFVLTRTLLHPDGRQATLETEGRDIETLVRCVDAVPHTGHWRSGPGWSMVLHHRLVVPHHRLVVPHHRLVVPLGSAAQDAAPQLILTRAQAWFAGLRLDATVSRVKNMPAALELQADGDGTPAVFPEDLLVLRKDPLVLRNGPLVLPEDPLVVSKDPLVLPEDLLSVLGLDWSRLARFGTLWRATVRVAGDGAERSRNAEARLQQGVQHLAATLAAAPGRFHEQFAAARWRVTARRGVPLLVCLLLIGASAAVPWMGITNDSVYQMLIFNAPPILMVWLFSMRELPRIEIPPLPRRPAAADWEPRRLELQGQRQPGVDAQPQAH